ncbi:hypothetical protein [Actinoplanes utahensis]|uniref:hypothetical protein n=1 Tax=Actinoplanes utahensis TaxID=1869 RepID=UPI00068C73D4|nr:hypothetical protein [Actinoplanes utahensis]
MPATPPARGPLRPALLALVLLGPAGCAGGGQASAAGPAREDLISEAADRVATARATTWTAGYRLAGGGTARVAWSGEPARGSYVFPSGRTIRTATALTRCATTSGETVCTATDPAGDDTDGVPAGTGLVTPGTVLDLLETAAIDPTVTAEPRETTIAGRHASCLAVAGSADFDVCVTVDGMVAAFTGTVGGIPVEMVLTDYRAGADEADFTVPPGARLVDRRD